MAKKSKKSPNGTSFHSTTLSCSANDLKRILGEPTYEDNTGEDKVNFEWHCETENGKVFTIYDWKEYRRLKETEEIEWHIGGHDRSTTEQALQELKQLLG